MNEDLMEIQKSVEAKVSELPDTVTDKLNVMGAKVLEHASNSTLIQSETDRRLKKLQKIERVNFDNNAEALSINNLIFSTDTAIKKQQIKNAMIVLHAEAKRTKKSQNHLNHMQKINHRKESSAEFIARNKLVGDENILTWYWFKLIDFIITTLVKTIEVLKLGNKAVRATLFYILIGAFAFITPFREFILSFIG